MAEEEIEISELELKETLSGDDLIPVENNQATFATTLTKIKDWLKSFFVGMSGDESIFGVKDFKSTPTIQTAANENNVKMAANIEFINHKLQVLNALPNIVDNNIFYFLTSGRLYKGSTLIMDSRQNPDYANAENLTKQNGEVQKDGWIFIISQGGNFTINGFTYSLGAAYNIYTQTPLLLKVSNRDAYSSTSWGSIIEFKFIPNK